MAMDQSTLVPAVVSFLKQLPADTLHLVLEEFRPYEKPKNSPEQIQRALDFAKAMKAVDYFTMDEIFSRPGPPITAFPTQHRDREAGDQSPLVKLLETFQHGEITRDFFFKFFHRFFKNEASITALSCSDLPPSAFYHLTKSPLPAMDHFTEMLKWTESKKQVEDLCKVILFMSRAGGVIDLHQSRFQLKGQIPRVTWKNPDNAIEIALLPHCHPVFLQRFLAQCDDRGFDFTTRSKLWHRFGHALPRGHHRAVSHMECIITRIYKDIFDKSNARGYGRKEVSSILENKVARLVGSKKHVDETEELALRRLGTVVDNVQTNFQYTELYAAKSWYNINMAVSGLVNHDTETEQGHRRHVFTIASRWDPRAEWIRSLLKVSPPAESKEGKKALEEFYSFWNMMVLKQGGRYEKGERKGHWRDWYDVESAKWYVSLKEAKKAFTVAHGDLAALLKF